MAGLAISKVVIGLEGAQHGVCWCIIGFNHSNAPCSHNDLWGICVDNLSSLSILPDPLTNTHIHVISRHKPGTSGADKQANNVNPNMHEIAHTEYFRAWTKPKVVYHRACERGNRIIAVVCRDPRRSHKAPSPSTSTYRGNEMKRRILSSFIWVPPTALYLTLDLYESCYGVTWTWGRKET